MGLNGATGAPTQRRGSPQARSIAGYSAALSGESPRSSVGEPLSTPATGMGPPSGGSVSAYKYCGDDRGHAPNQALGTYRGPPAPSPPVVAGDSGVAGYSGNLGSTVTVDAAPASDLAAIVTAEPAIEIVLAELGTMRKAHNHAARRAEARHDNGVLGAASENGVEAASATVER